MQKTQKLYCYVDETGQDTQGQLFIAVAIMTQQPQDALTDILEAVEVASGKRKVKWHRSNRLRRAAYISKTLDGKLPVQTYYRVFRGKELSYELATIDTIANAINAYCEREGIEEYKATVVIDGMPHSLQHRYSKLLRNLGIRTKSVRGQADESNAMIRLADAVAGLARDAYEGDEYFRQLSQGLEKQGIIRKI